MGAFLRGRAGHSADLSADRTARRALSALRRAQELNAFISLLPTEGDGPRVAIKDLIDVAGSVTTGGGRVFPQIPAETDAPMIRRLRADGCVLVGKTNMDEWAYGALGANEHYGDMHNPWAPERIAGGSSGGSAIAVATGAVDWAIGTDTGGSIRIPAGMCGVVGFKPTTGTIDRTGVMLLSRTLDTVGTLASDVRTAVRAAKQLAGVDRAPLVVPSSLANFRVGVPRAWIDDLDDTSAAVWTVVSAGLPNVDLGARDEIAAPALVILDFEAAARHRDSIEEDGGRYGAAVAAKIRSSMAIGEPAYRDALAQQIVVRKRVAAAMAHMDALLLPVTTSVAPHRTAIGSRAQMLQYVRPFNTTGQPVIALPAPSAGLPVGMQVVGSPGADDTCAAVALAFEAAWGARQ